MDIPTLGAAIAYIKQNGSSGPPGKAATINVGTVTTGEPNTEVIIVNSGTSNAAIFDFTIPKGYTPQKNIDYWTEDDKQEIIDDVLNSIPNGDGVYY